MNGVNLGCRHAAIAEKIHPTYTYLKKYHIKAALRVAFFLIYFVWNDLDFCTGQIKA